MPWGKCLKYILKINTKPSRQHDSNFVKNMYVYIPQASIVIFKSINFPALISNMINTDRTK